MRKFFISLIGALALSSSGAWAQFDTCGQSFSHPGPGQRTITMTQDVNCPATAAFGVTLGNNIRFSMAGHKLGGFSRIEGGVGIVVNGNNVTVDGRSPGRVVGFARGVMVQYGDIVALQNLNVWHSWTNGVYTSPGTETYIVNSFVDGSGKSGIVCNGDCTIQGSTMRNNAHNGMVCAWATCRSHRNTFALNGWEDVLSKDGDLTEFRSCPNEIDAIWGSNIRLLEDVKTCSIDCSEDATSVFTGTTGVCR